ncbi:cysteine hydrolase family protein [Pendulispora albinea]|uniref:Cysteine hydrolase n=1 Tax=Pendulispora albinea TaxID=2741071 RepID=A0ABZ2LJH0_9BACT
MNALILVDVQIGILAGPPAVRGASAMLDRIHGLIERARQARALIVYVQHDGPRGHRAAPYSPGWLLDPSLQPVPGELVVHKTECDAFLGTVLDEELRKRKVTRIVIAGCMTQYCIDTTCRRAFSLGYDVTLAADAHATADTPGGLTAAQIVAHHNATLDGFGDAPTHDLRVRPSGAISFVRDGG